MKDRFTRRELGAYIGRGLGLASLLVVACSTSEPQPQPKKTVAPIPTLSDEQFIEVIRRLQNDSLARGEFKIPAPDGIQDNFYLYFGTSISLGVGVLELGAKRPDGELNLQSLLDGKISRAEQTMPGVNQIDITRGDNVLQFLFPTYGSFNVKKGDDIKLGKPILNIRYDFKNPLQKEFENSELSQTMQTIVTVIRLFDSKTQTFRNLNGGNFIGGSSSAQSIPLLK